MAELLVLVRRELMQRGDLCVEISFVPTIPNHNSPMIHKQSLALVQLPCRSSYGGECGVYSRLGADVVKTWVRSATGGNAADSSALVGQRV